MKKRGDFIWFVCLVVGMGMICADAWAWGQKGHDVTCAIAERHLKKAARKRIAEIFDGKSIVYWSNWMDNASHQKEFAYTKTWHYRDVGMDETYANAVENESGDVLTAISAQVAALKDGSLNHEAQAIALRMLVHLVGDLHCPMHMGRKEDAGGNKWQVQFFNNGTNLHSIWDSGLIENAHKWTYSEWVDQIDRVDKKAIATITEGSPYDWGEDTHRITQQVYEETPAGKKVSYDEVARWAPVIEQQFLKGGLRLAKVLNDLFG